MSLSPRGDLSPICSPEDSLLRVSSSVSFALPTLVAQIDAITPSGSGGLFIQCSVRLHSCKGGESKHVFYSQIGITGIDVSPMTLTSDELAERFAHPNGRKLNSVATFEEACKFLAEHLERPDDQREFVSLTIADYKANEAFAEVLRKQSSKCRILLLFIVPRHSFTVASSINSLFPK